MTESPAPAGRFDALSSTAQQRTHVSRREWEGAWIAGQRAVTAVITADTDSRERSSGTELTPHLPHDATVPGGSAAITAEEARAQIEPHQTRGLSADASRVAGPRARFLTSLDLAHPGVSPHARTPMAGSGISSRPLATPGHEPRASARQFAFWHDGPAVDLAMRLKDTGSAAAIVGHLREWLREGGSYLRRILVNGTELGRPPPDAAPPGRPAGRGLNRHL